MPATLASRLFFPFRTSRVSNLLFNFSTSSNKDYTSLQLETASRRIESYFLCGLYFILFAVPIVQSNSISFRESTAITPKGNHMQILFFLYKRVRNCVRELLESTQNVLFPMQIQVFSCNHISPLIIFCICQNNPL